MMEDQEHFTATDAAIEKAREILKEFKSGGYLSRYGVTRRTGGCPRKTPDGACFAEILRRPDYFKEAEQGGTFFVSYLGVCGGNGKAVYSEDTKVFLDFLCSPESPWRLVVKNLVTAIPEEIERDGGFIFQDLENLDGRVLFSFLSAARDIGERSRTFVNFKRFVGKGMGKTEAHLLGSNLTGTEGLLKKMAYMGGHEPFDQFCITDSVQNILDGTPNMTAPILVKAMTGGGPMTRVFKGKENILFSNFWKDLDNLNDDQCLVIAKMLRVLDDGEKLLTLIHEFSKYKRPKPVAKKIKLAFNYIEEDAA